MTGYVCPDEPGPSNRGFKTLGREQIAKKAIGGWRVSCTGNGENVRSSVTPTEVAGYRSLPKTTRLCLLISKLFRNNGKWV
jgi:hypothetical protein